MDFDFSLPCLVKPAPLVDWEQWKDCPDVFNVALKVAGDPRTVRATLPDLLALSKWFAAAFRQRGNMRAGPDILQGVEVPCSVPFELLEDTIVGLYQGSIHLTGQSLGSVLKLADAMQASLFVPS